MLIVKIIYRLYYVLKISLKKIVIQDSLHMVHTKTIKSKRYINAIIFYRHFTIKFGQKY